MTKALIRVFIAVMTSLLSRFFSDPAGAEISKPASSDNISRQAEASPKSVKCHSLNVRTRKSITSLFGFSAKVTATDDDCNALVHKIGHSQEVPNYPVYDPGNPEHEPKAPSIDVLDSAASTRRRESRSSTRASLWKRSLSPRRWTVSDRARFRLQGLTESLRAKAKVFYEAEQRSSDEELMPHVPSVPLTPTSAKSVSSKKSVRFRSGHSVILNAHSNSSPISIPVKSPPSLSMVDIPSTSLFELTSDKPRDLERPAKPAESPSSNILPDPFFTEPNRSILPRKLEEEFFDVGKLRSPIPGTDSPLGDPFDDAAAALYFDNQKAKVSTVQTTSDRDYISDEGSNADMNGTGSACTRPSKIASAQGVTDCSLANVDTQKFNQPDVAEDSHDLSLNSSVSPVEIVTRRTKTSIPTLEEQLIMSRLPSETQYDADAEVSDGGELKREPTKNVDAKFQYRQEIHQMVINEHNASDANIVRPSTWGALSSARNATVPCATLEKPSLGKTEEVPVHLSAGSEGVVHSADRAERGLIENKMSPASDILVARRQQKHLTSTSLGPELPPFEPSFRGIANAEQAALGGPNQHSPTLSLSRINDCLNQNNTVMPPKNGVSHQLPAVMSSTLAHHPRKHLRTDEELGTERTEHDLPFAREDAEKSTSFQFKRQDQPLLTVSSSPADIPLPHSVALERKRVHHLYNDNTFHHSDVGSFEEPRSADAAYAGLEASPRPLAQRLRSEGISRNLWRQLHLLDETAPPENHSQCIESESLEVCAATAATAKAFSTAESRMFHGSSLCDSNGEQRTGLKAHHKSNDLTSPLSLLCRRQGGRSCLNEARLLESARSSSLPVASSRGSSLSEPVPFVGVRQPFSQGSTMGRELLPDVPRPLRLESLPTHAAPRSQSPRLSESEAQSVTGHHSSLCSPRDMRKESADSDAETEHYSGDSSSQSGSVLAQPTHSVPSLQNRALLKQIMPAGKQNLDGPHKTERNLFSTGCLSMSSGSAGNFSCSADSGGRSANEHPQKSSA